ncbi:hypothetical protein ACA910_020199 [Epithemia clementina (nom. ined.)]
MASSPLRIGIFGGGIVGGGVYELLKTASSRVAIEKICVRSLSKPRDFAAPSSLFTTDPKDILDNETIDCVVEVMGGTGFAKTVILEALQKGKSVVTANKALLAEHLDELRQAALAAQKPLMYEAAVCGGIPIINALQTAYTPDVITKLQGIANGTTNFMLTKMEDGADYNAVLKEAQELGYAEADPTADVEGHDVRAKLALMAKLAYGTTIAPDAMACVGISQITAADFAYAKALSSTIKLLGTATCDTSDTSSAVSILVLPALVPRAHFLASVRGSGNAVAVTSQNMGPCWYTGPGAGRFPTANSVVADIWRVAMGAFDKSCDPFPTQTNRPIISDFTSAFYVRATTSAADVVQSKSEQHGVSLNSPLPSGPGTEGALAWITKECSYKQIQALLESLKQEGSMPAVAMPLLTVE